MQKYYPEYYQEVVGLQRGFASFGHPEITVEYLCSWVYYHELAHATFANDDVKVSRLLESTGDEGTEIYDGCTGTLAADQSGYVFHGRNMDQSPAAIRNVTVHLKFIKNK